MEIPASATVAAPAGDDTESAPPAGWVGDAGAESTVAELVRVPLWVLVGARSGDKGADANIGVWADQDDVAAWLGQALTTETFKAVLPEVEPYAVSRYPLPNLR